MAPDDVKDQLVDTVPTRIRNIQFGVSSKQDIVRHAVIEVSDRNVLEDANVNVKGGNRAFTPNGPMDRRMGTASRFDHDACQTCKEGVFECPGHFGQIKLALPAFHIGYMKHIVDVLHCICKDCGKVLLDKSEKGSFLRSFGRPGLDSLQRASLAKKVVAECRKKKLCVYCHTVNGSVRKVPGHPLKIIHNRYDAYNRSTAKNKQPPPGKRTFDESWTAAKTMQPEIEKHLKKAVDDMHPLKVLELFTKIDDHDCDLLGMIPAKSRPEMLIWQYIPVPPVAVRPSVQQESGVTMDDLTNKIGDIVHVSGVLRAGLEKGFPVQVLMEQWDFLQLQVAMYINSETPGLRAQGLAPGMRGFCQRLKGKQGRFRQNLSGKRVDFSGRTVIGPDPNLGIDEVAVPERVAKNMTYPEKVTRYNIEKMRRLVRTGSLKHPGANTLTKQSTGKKISLQVLSRPGKSQGLIKHAKELAIGDVVERHLEDGDIVLFNRQPSLHKLSILSHRAKIRPWRTFRLNECVCNPYNADFDGDEMNLHVPQTEEARTEAIELMGVKYNLATPKNGTPIIAAIQDFITAAYLLSNKSNFFTRPMFSQICSYMFNADAALDPDTGEMLPVEIPPPTVLKPQALWTGKQVFNVLLRPNKKSRVLVNLEAAGKQFKRTPHEANDLNIDDAYLVIRNSEVMCGVMDKATVGDGKKDSVFYVLMRDFGPDHAVQGMNRVAKLSARWLTNNGFSIGISDVTPGQKLRSRKDALVHEAYAKCDQLIEAYKAGKLERDSGCDQEQTMENRIGGILSDVRAAAGAICFDELSKWNAPLLMAKCGSKGSNINVSQMVASVGQQMIGGARVADGFQDRSLPHFPKYARQPHSKGFVENSFWSGLLPTEFIFHAMSGREGLVDTAVKTAETGYMSRRLMKSLEDMSAQYDDTVRNSSGGLIQFQYGDDNLDPADMEGKAKPVNFDRTFSHAVASTWNNAEATLLPKVVMEHTISKLNAERSKHTRFRMDGVTQLDYYDSTDLNIDQKESIRDFLNTVEGYISDKAKQLETTLLWRGMSAPNKRKHFGAKDAEKFNAFADGIAKISQSALDTFIALCLEKYHRSKVQPGHAVGAIGAQSIGEPGTQMTLKTFHFAGVAGMSITQGVPRIKEIINASNSISTPVITCDLDVKDSGSVARHMKGRIEKTYLRDVVDYIEDVWYPDGAYVNMRLDWNIIKRLSITVNAWEIGNAINRHKPLKWGTRGTEIKCGMNCIRVSVPDLSASPRKIAAKSLKAQKEFFERVQQVKTLIGDVVIAGLQGCHRAIIKKSDTKNAEGQFDHQLLVEGYGLRDCMNIPGIKWQSTKSNHVMETHKVLGIEAARTTIINEINSVMGSMDIDPRHMQLLADVMTVKGEVFGITRFGLQKTRDSVLQLASFEKTPDHLFEAAAKGKIDDIKGVSECIIMGKPVNLGTGAMRVIRPMNFGPGDIGPKKTMFEEAWAAL